MKNKRAGSVELVLSAAPRVPSGDDKTGAAYVAILQPYYNAPRTAHRASHHTKMKLAVVTGSVTALGQPQ